MRGEIGAEPPDCQECPRPDRFSPENTRAWEVFWAVADLLGDGWGGVRLGNAEAAARALGHEWDGDLLARLQHLIRLVLRQADPEEDEDGD